MKLSYLLLLFLYLYFKAFINNFTFPKGLARALLYYFNNTKELAKRSKELCFYFLKLFIYQDKLFT